MKEGPTLSDSGHLPMASRWSFQGIPGLGLRQSSRKRNFLSHEKSFVISQQNALSLPKDDNVSLCA